MVAAMLVGIAPSLPFSAVALGCFIISMSVTHTFLDAIPSVFLGAPDDTAVGVLPGHRFLLQGQGLIAVKLMLIGSLGAVVLSVVLFPLFCIATKYGYPYIERYIGWLVLAAAGFMILRDRSVLWAASIFLLAGCLGLVAYELPIEPMLPMLSGMFGVSTLLLSLKDNNRLPAQQDSAEVSVSNGTLARTLFSGQATGFLTAVLPGVGSSSAAVIATQWNKRVGDAGFLLLVGSIGTVNFVLSLAALLTLGKARNGSIVALQQLMPTVTTVHIIIFLAATLIAAGFASIVVLLTGRWFSRLICRIDYEKTCLAVMLFVVFLVCLVSGWIGLLLLMTSTALGLIAPLVNVSRTHAMGCIMLPVMGYFLL